MEKIRFFENGLEWILVFSLPIVFSHAAYEHFGAVQTVDDLLVELSRRGFDLVLGQPDFVLEMGGELCVQKGAKVCLKGALVIVGQKNVKSEGLRFHLISTFWLLLNLFSYLCRLKFEIEKKSRPNAYPYLAIINYECFF